MILSLKRSEAEALRRSLADVPADAELQAVRDKLERGLGPALTEPLPGQTTIDEHLGEAA